MTSTVSIIKTLDVIVDKKINESKQMTINQTLLFKAGSSLTPINLNTVSN